MEKIKFQEVGGIKDILNAEGTILALRENDDPEGDAQKERLYIMGECDKKNLKVFTKVNNKALELFFQGRISIKELFLLRLDEPYVIEESLGGNAEIKQSYVFADQIFLDEILGDLRGVNQHYYSFCKNTRQHKDPFKEVLQIIDLFYYNGVNGPDSGVLLGKQWLSENKINEKPTV
jgi:hypothetical protein